MARSRERHSFVREREIARVVRGDHGDSPEPLLGDDPLDDGTPCLVEIRARLVEEEKIGLVQRRERELDALALAGRERGERLFGMGIGRKADALEQRARAAGSRHQAADPFEEGQVLFGRQLSVKGEIRRHPPDVPGDVARLAAIPGVFTFEENPRTPSARPNQACEGLQQGGLSAPVLSRDTEDTPRLDAERNRPEGTASEGAREVLGDKPHGDSIIGPAVLPRLLGVLVFLAISVYRWTLRVSIVGEEHRQAVRAQGKKPLHAIWHQRMVGGILAHRGEGYVTMASKSLDGEIIATFLTLWGFKAARGSSSKGGDLAVLEFLEALKGAPGGALTPDGPRGPARRCKRGILTLAEQGDTLILPSSSSSSRPKFLGSWDRFLLPLPFSRCVVVFAPALERVSGESEDAFLARAAAAIDAVTSEADRLCGVKDAPREREKAT